MNPCFAKRSTTQHSRASIRTRQIVDNMHRQIVQIARNSKNVQAYVCQSKKLGVRSLTSSSLISNINNQHPNRFAQHKRFFSTDNLEKEFQAAVANLQKVTAEVDNEKKLQLYALFKQSSNGPCTGEKPSVFNVVEKAKWTAWKGLGDISADEAKKRYIATVGELLSASGSSATAQPEMILEKRDHVYWIRLNRPKALNAITPEMYQGFIDSLKSAAEDSDIKFVVVTGNGRYFSSGNDLKNFIRAAKEYDGDVDKATQASRDLCQRFVAAFIDFPKPLIAAVNGPALGIMFTTLGLFDAVIAADTVTFQCPFSALGQSPEGCSTYMFPRIFGYSLTSELLYFNYQMPVEEAHRLGFVSRIVAADKLEAHVEEWLGGEKGLVKTCYPNSMSNSKNLVRNKETRLKMHEVNKIECDVLMQSWKSEECMNALQQFYTRK